MKKRILSIIVAATVILSSVGCGSNVDTSSSNTASVEKVEAAENTDKKNSVEKIPLTIRISNFSGTVVPYHIAVDYGFVEKAFAESPYDVSFEITNFAGGAAAVEAAQAGELDILTSGDQMITTAILENGLPFKLIGNSYTNKQYAFIASADSGIKTVDDLKGKRVGVTIGTNMYIGVLAFLEDNGYSIDDVEIVNLSAADSYTAILGGDIDWTIATTKKTRDSLLNEEGGVLLGYNGDYKFNECVFGVSDEFAAQYPDVVTTLVKLFYDVTEYANENPDVVKEDMKRNYDSDDETVENTLSDTNYIVEFTPEILESIQKTLHYSYTTGINSREADVSEVIDFTYLEQAGLK